MISPQQYRKLMKHYQTTGKLGQSAEKAGVDPKTARKYVRGAAGPEEPRPARTWRTHEDAFAAVWPEVEEELRREPALQAKVLFEEVCRRHPERFVEGQRRSFERRVRAWKLHHGPEPERVFTQEHRPGERLQIDWFHADGLEVRIGGERFEHRFVHVVLPFSNWEWARVCRSESFLSLKVGLQSALHELGAAPAICQSDQSSTATHPKGKGSRGREFNERYLGLLAHYGMRAGVIGVGAPQQNGDVESAHHHLRTALDQALKLRGSREFASVEDYEGLVFALLQARNAGRAAKLAQERAFLRALPGTRLPEYEEIECVVNREGIARVGRQGYSVPARWIGQRLRARISETAISFHTAGEKVAEVERRSGSGQGVYVDWRHVLPQLLRKPGAFARWRHRASLYPSPPWKQLHDTLSERFSAGRAEREYLGILALALEHGLEAVETALAQESNRPTLDGVRSRLGIRGRIITIDFTADLCAYDALIGEAADGGEDEAAEAAR